MSKDIQISILNDLLTELRASYKFCKMIAIILCGLLLLSFSANIFLTIYSQNIVKNISEKYNTELMRFINETEFNSTIEMNNADSTNSGSITVGAKDAN
jgi:hypothetical protein